MKGPKPKPIAERFWPKVQVGNVNECWIWTGNRDKNGYGVIRKGPAKEGWLQAPRVSWELNSGMTIPDGLCVLHSCDNPPCVNPAHLHLGTNGDNNAERNERKRTACGSDIPTARLSEEQVKSILAEYVPRKPGNDKGYGGTNQKRLPGSRRYLAEKYGVSASAIQSIVEGRNWKHVQ